MRPHKSKHLIGAYVQLFCGERPATNSSGICLDHTNRSPNQLRGNSQASANPSDSRRRRSDVRVRPKIYIQHQRIGSLDEDALPVTQSRVDIGDTVNDERLQPRRQFLNQERTLVSLEDSLVVWMNQPGIELFPLRYRTRNARIACIGLQPTCGI